MQLVSTNIGGNLHEASNAINKMGLAEYVLTMDFSGSGTIVVFRVSDEQAPKLRAALGTLPEYQGNPIVSGKTKYL